MGLTALPTPQPSHLLSLPCPRTATPHSATALLRSQSTASWSAHLLQCFKLSCSGCLVAKSCPTLCDPMDYSMPDFPVLHYLLKFAQTHVAWVGKAKVKLDPAELGKLRTAFFVMLQTGRRMWDTLRFIHVRFISFQFSWENSESCWWLQHGQWYTEALAQRKVKQRYEK